MASRFETYGLTETGARLTRIVTMPEMIPEYRALSRVGKPAVQAIGADVAPIIDGLPSKAERDAASQFVGWRVAKVMRGLGYLLIQERGRVSDAPFRTGAVWSYAPGHVKVAFSVPAGITRKVDVLVRSDRADDVMADVDAKDEGEGGRHSVRTVLRLNVPFDEAIEFATAYAERHGYGYIHVIDGGRRLPAGAIGRL